MPIMNTVIQGGGGSGGTDEYANVITIENLMGGLSLVEETELASACNHISQFLYGTDNN